MRKTNTLFAHHPPPEAEDMALELEERFRWLGIRLNFGKSK